MKLLLVTGIFPPDHGGPASYVPAIAKALADRGHEIVSIVTLSDHVDQNDSAFVFPVIRIRRGTPWLLRALITIVSIVKQARAAEVIYLNGLVLEGVVAGIFLKKRRQVIKVVGDLIWERARNRNATAVDLEKFQTAKLPWSLRLLRML